MCDGDYCIFFEENASIFLKEDDNSIKKSNYDFVNICDLATMGPNSIVDIIGKVVKVGPMNNVQLRNSTRCTDRKNVSIADASGAQIELTLWGDSASKPIMLDTVLACKCVRLTDFQGLSLTFD